MEKATLLLAALNPIDLARVVVLLQMDISALMGYTGALFREWLGSSWGILSAMIILLLWAVVPMLLAVRVFRKKRGYILIGGVLGLVAYMMALFAYTFAPLSYVVASNER